MQKEVVAKHKYARMSAQKARLVADLIRGLSVEKAINVLEFCQKKAASAVKAVLKSAINNAEHNFGLDIDELTVKKVFVDQAASFKRLSPRAKGRSNRIVKQNCHITIVVA